MTDDIKKNAKEVADKIHDAADKASEKFTQGIHYGRERAQDAAERFQDGFDDLGDFSQDKAREIRDEFLSAIGDDKCGCPAALFTRQRPLLGLILAALVGFVLGRIIRRRG
ncbi:hypothetical protein FAI41_02575 [Acetobacteraceae bacterium]|nr:hypothetical protein FAI41_02575 [Acetobacteraceae bacterium]